MIVFDEHRIKGKILNSHNNSVVRFHSDSTKQNVSCEVKITTKGESYVFKIHPSPSKQYYFNFREIVSKLFKDIKDECNYEPFKDLYRDETADLTIEVNYKILFDDLTTDSHDETYYFVYAVMQEWECKQYAERGGNFPLHHSDRNKQTYLTCFEGYPFDVSVYGPVNFTSQGYLGDAEFLAVSLPYPRTKTGENLGGATYGVNRYIASNGESRTNAVYNNYNGITINEHVIKIETREHCTGHYLKWRNSYGGWDYFLFEDKHIEQSRSKIGKEVVQDFDVFESERTRIAEVAVQESKTLYANRIRTEFLGTLKGLLASPKVYLYLGEKGEKPKAKDWQTVYVKGRIQHHTAKRKFTLKINVNYPNSETL